MAENLGKIKLRIKLVFNRYMTKQYSLTRNKPDNAFL